MKSYLQGFATSYPWLASAIHTFVGTFLTTVIASLALIPASDLLSSKYWTLAVVIGIFSAAIRAGVKAISPLIPTY